MDQGYELSDVLIVPKHSNVISRGDADLSVDLGKLKLQIPIVASPMEGIVGVKIIKELGEMGGLGILHRFYNNEDKRVKDVNILRKSNVNFGVAVGLGDPFYMCALNNGANVICIDVANGYLQSVLDFTNTIAKYIKVDKDDLKVNLEKRNNLELLEINVMLPERDIVNVSTP